MRIPVVAVAALLAAMPAQAQWGKPVPSGNVVGTRMTAVPGGHLVTVSVPYQLTSLDPAVEKVGIGCRVNYRSSSRGTASIDREVDITPIAGAASGTATMTWDSWDFPQQIGLKTITGDACWLVFYVQGLGPLSFESLHSNAGALTSPVPAVKPEPGTNPVTEETFSFSQ